MSTSQITNLRPLNLRTVKPDSSLLLPLIDTKPHLLLCATGSVATIKIPSIISALSSHTLSIRLIFTPSATEFLRGQSPEQPSIDEIAKLPNVDGVYFDEDEWKEPWVRGNKILHIELRRWADIMVVAPLSASGMAKIVGGWAEGLVFSVVRAWDTTGEVDGVREIGGEETDGEGSEAVNGNAARRKKRIIVAPSMNTAMWKQPVTAQHVKVLDEEWGVRNGGWFEVLQPMEKELACGDVGGGAMKDWREIVTVVEDRLHLRDQ
ncbi:flavo protein [Sporormia fimetaria CBS 119925]|uniref:Flavo protein n=1 Tax=Sporormia fimetaria CBS 119925 TaxID=1340428 RepID=A0A6A6UWW8_9PLEO|nr:flavo protein [Sporormia fimetaria CBS 119925]